MTVYRKAFEQENRPKLDLQLAKLKMLEHKHFEQLELFLDASEQLATIKEKRYKNEYRRSALHPDCRGHCPGMIRNSGIRIE
jgi:hypothetical protein